MEAHFLLSRSLNFRNADGLTGALSRPPQLSVDTLNCLFPTESKKLANRAVCGTKEFVINPLGPIEASLSTYLIEKMISLLPRLVVVNTFAKLLTRDNDGTLV